MDKILELLKDPSWWFSALFIAIMASVIAAFLKDWISSIISIFSSSYRDWSNKKAIEQNKYIQELAGNSTLLIISYFRVMVGIILFTSCFLAYLLFPIRGRFGFGKTGLLSWESEFFAIIFSTLSIGSAFLSIRRLKVSDKARKLYKKKENANFIPLS